VTLHGLAGYADSEHDNPIQTTILFDRLNVDGYAYDYRESSRLPLITYGNAPVEDPTAWTLTQIRLRPQTADNKLETLMGDIGFDLTDTVRLSGGLQWKKYKFETTEQRRSNGTTANQETIIPGFAASTPIADYSELVNFGNDLDLPSGSTTTWLIPDLAAANDLFDLYNTTVFPMGIEPALGNNNSIKEEDSSIYVQLDFRSESLPLRGNIGVRYVETDQTSTGYVFTAGAPLLTTVSREYDNTLPSLNLAWDVNDDIVIRLAAAGAMSRPGLAIWRRAPRSVCPVTTAR
jgi:TonB-dependent receptor